MAIIIAHEKAIDIISIYLAHKGVGHTKYPELIRLKSIPAKCLASIKSIVFSSESIHLCHDHYMGY